ncbi:hypothetical protein BG006_002633 [Podila minutissima]|uniref:Uncharacterized protein n=1 Tax=Podila minutissima TaxID=64525 RepID=A0A9P5VG73_9FUNG|nr:hypothetical protein BG006_002633 [Podila minutissima]
MASFDEAESQYFVSEKGILLAGLATRVCPESGLRYILWSDIQGKFAGIRCLRGWDKELALFMVNTESELQEHSAEEPLQNQQDADRSDATTVNSESLGHPSSPPQSELSQLRETLLELYKLLQSNIHNPAESMVTFRQCMANVQYYHSKFESDIKNADNAEIRDPTSGLDKSQMLQEIRDLQKQVPEWDLQNNYHNMLHLDDSWRRYETSSLFIILPSDLNSWVNSDSATHQLRIHFLCSNLQSAPPTDKPQHVHLSNHPGYNLLRPHEFLREYGYYVLRLLQIIKCGYSDAEYQFLPLDGDKILWNCDPNVVGSHINKDTITHLVDRAIAYLHELSLPQERNPAPTGDQAAMIKSFLDLQGGGNPDSNLIPCIASDHQVHWMCQEHAHQHVDQGCLQELQDFVSSHGGHVDMQQATLSVELGSESETDEFRRLLTGTKYAFDISLTIRWNPTRANIRELCLDIGKTNAVFLEIDGVTPDIQPREYVQYSVDIFCDKILQEARNLLAITLLNYPRPQEQCLYFRQIVLQSPLTPDQNPHQLEFLRHDVRKFTDMVDRAKATSDLTTAAGELSAMLAKHGRSDATVFTSYRGSWSGVVDLKKGAFVDVYSVDMACTQLVLSSGSLRKITLYVYEMDVDQAFFSMLKANTELEELNVTHDPYNHNKLHSITKIFRIWHDASSSFRLTVLDRMQDHEGRIVAQLAIRGAARDLPDVEGGEEEQSLVCLQQTKVALEDIEILQWHCDKIFGQLSDEIASFLDTATQQHPSILTSFSIDITDRSPACLVSIQNIISRSNLEHLVVDCAPIKPAISDLIAQVLDSIQWPSLKSLVLTGHNIDEWIQLWLRPVAPSLLCLQIRGTGSTIQALSHESVLFVLDMVLASPMVELHFENVHLPGLRDWELFVKSMDPSVDVEVRNCACKWPLDSDTLEE